MQRTCTCCGKAKPLEEYRFNEKSGRYSHRCVPCGNPNEKAMKRRYRTMRHYLVRKLGQAKCAKRNKRKRRVVSVTIDDLLALLDQQGGRCAITGIELTHCGESQSDASIDRIDSNGEYELGNIRLVCVGVNMMRGRMGDEELGEWCINIAKGMGLWK